MPEGRIRERPWYVVEPVAKAIALAESLTDSDYVFDWGLFLENGAPTRYEPTTAEILHLSLQDFIRWINNYCDANGRESERIPDDPHGAVRYSRFRRTLAWFIFRRPGGRVALGVQYGHILRSTGYGYASRAEFGHQGVFEMEEALALADNLAAANKRLENGEAVSGPAASRYLEGVTAFSNSVQHEFGGRALTTRQMTALKNDGRLRIFENELQLVACCYDATKALCHPDNRRRNRSGQTPDLTRCQPHCANTARTDHHIERMRELITKLNITVQSGALAAPMERRFQDRIESLSNIVLKHEETKVQL